MGQEMLYISLAKHTHIHTDIQTQPCSDFLGLRSDVYLNVITVMRWCIYTNIIITAVPVRRGPEGAMLLRLKNCALQTQGLIINMNTMLYYWACSCADVYETIICSAFVLVISEIRLVWDFTFRKSHIFKRTLFTDPGLYCRYCTHSIVTRH